MRQNLLEHLGLQAGNSLGIQEVISEFFSSGVNRLKIAALFLAFMSRLKFRVGNIKLPSKTLWLSEHYIFYSGLDLFRDPLGTLKPYQFQITGPIV